MKWFALFAVVAAFLFAVPSYAQEEVTIDLEPDQWIIVIIVNEEGDTIRPFGFINKTEGTLQVPIAGLLESPVLDHPAGWSLMALTRLPAGSENIEVPVGVLAQSLDLSQFGWGYADFIGVTAGGSVELDAGKTTSWVWSEPLE